MTATTDYTCRFCRQHSDASVPACPSCGAPIDLRDAVSRSGWEKQPPIADMARIQFGQSHLQIEGTQVPVADFNLVGPDSIYFSHHVLLWADESAQLSAMQMKGGWNRVLAGMPLLMVQGQGPGHIALSDNSAGELLAIPLQDGQGMWVREHRFLAATNTVGFDWWPTNIWFQTGNGDDREMHYPLGEFGDVFSAAGGPGLLLLHAPGNVFIRDLAEGETILLQPSALIYRDIRVRAHLHLEYPNVIGMNFWGSYQHRSVWLRLIGPGRVAVQSVFAHPEESEPITADSGATYARW